MLFSLKDAFKKVFNKHSLYKDEPGSLEVFRCKNLVSAASGPLLRAVGAALTVLRYKKAPAGRGKEARKQAAAAGGEEVALARQHPRTSSSPALQDLSSSRRRKDGAADATRCIRVAFYVWVSSLLPPSFFHVIQNATRGREVVRQVFVCVCGAHVYPKEWVCGDHVCMCCLLRAHCGGMLSIRLF